MDCAPDLAKSLKTGPASEESRVFGRHHEANTQRVGGAETFGGGGSLGDPAVWSQAGLDPQVG